MLRWLRERFRRKDVLSAVPTVSAGGWYPIVREPFTGAWQRNVALDARTCSTFHADFACVTVISRDIAKLGTRLMQEDAAGIKTVVQNPAYSPVLRRPNDYQTPNQFWESWMLSKLRRGNTYVLKVRDARGVVTALYVLNPDRVQVLEADDGSVFYRLSQDYRADIGADVTVPAKEIIHDRFNCLYHHLVGVPPIYASCLAAMQGLNIQNYSANLYANASQPGGILIAPGKISEETANRLRDRWEGGQAGRHLGRLAVLGDGLKYEKLALTAVEGQLIEQLKWSAEVVCSTYHVPPFMIGVGPQPSYNNVQALNLIYYTQCLQSLIEDAEACINDGLGLADRPDLGVEFNLSKLLRMDGASQADTVTKLVGGGVYTPNEARAEFNLKPLTGGNTVYLQQQDFSLEALAKRDAQADPFGTAPAPAPDPEPEPEEDEEADIDGEVARAVAAHEYRKALDALV